MSDEPLAIARPFLMPLMSTAYLVRAGADVVVVDAGLPQTAPALIRAVARFGTPRAILVTHAHYDHVGGAAALAAATGARVHASDHEADEMARGHAGARFEGKRNIRGLIFTPFVRLERNRTVPPVIDCARVRDGDLLPIGEGVRVVALPGHTIGQVGYLFEGTGDFFVGDAFASIVRPGRPPWHEDEAAELASLRRIAGLSWSRLHPGHGGPVERPAFERFLARLPKEPRRG
ncbi:MBL fold metallo-hydrolase [Salinarimonas sp.]|uniref:MBL fold metallo-hydrolase n=1 Tax=Salinarimonas sp. TaxID=2766526 RepID=UPI0032D8EA27